MIRFGSTLSRPRALATCAALFAAFLAFGFPAMGAAFDASTPEGGAFDTVFFYSPAEAARKAASYGAEEAAAAIRVHWTYDLAFPLAYGLFCASAWAFGLRSLAVAGSPPRWGFVMVPIAAALFDLGENAAVSALLASRSGAVGPADVLASALTIAKWVSVVPAFAGALCLPVAGLLASAIRRRRGRGAPAAVPGDGYRVEFARADDIPAIMRLEDDGFHAGIREDESVFRARLATFPEGFVVLRAAGDVRGYLCAERWSGVPPAEARYFALGHDPVPRHDPAGTALYLASMTVDPGLRGAGLGSRLLNEGASLIRGAAPGVLVELLVVNELWTGARRIYEAAGFSAYGVIDSFFARPGGKPSAGIAMRRPA